MAIKIEAKCTKCGKLLDVLELEPDEGDEDEFDPNLSLLELAEDLNLECECEP